MYLLCCSRMLLTVLPCIHCQNCYVNIPKFSHIYFVYLQYFDKLVYIHEPVVSKQVFWRQSLLPLDKLNSNFISQMNAQKLLEFTLDDYESKFWLVKERIRKKIYDILLVDFISYWPGFSYIYWLVTLVPFHNWSDSDWRNI